MANHNGIIYVCFHGFVWSWLIRCAYLTLVLGCHGQGSTMSCACFRVTVPLNFVLHHSFRLSCMVAFYFSFVFPPIGGTKDVERSLNIYLLLCICNQLCLSWTIIWSKLRIRNCCSVFLNNYLVWKLTFTKVRYSAIVRQSIMSRNILNFLVVKEEHIHSGT
jgi:hypothetical protein